MKREEDRAMRYDLPPREEWPSPGFYYEYLHDSHGTVNNYAYYFYGVGRHTEMDCRPEDQFFQVYRPLFEESSVFHGGKIFYVRPLYMFYDPVEHNGSIVQRFTLITDPGIIAQLKSIKLTMYPDG
jgi:hypothetical protein